MNNSLGTDKRDAYAQILELAGDQSLPLDARLDRIKQLVQFKWLGDKVVRSQPHAASDQIVILRTAKEDERNHRGARVVLEGTQHRITVHAWHVDVAQHDVRAQLPGEVDAGAAFAGLGHLEAGGLQDPGDGRKGVGVVVDEQHAHRRGGGRSGR